MARTDRRALVFRAGAGIVAAIAVFPACRRERPERGLVTPTSPVAMASPTPAEPVPPVEQPQPPASPPTATAAPAILGAVYEVTIPPPSPTPPSEPAAAPEPTPLDLRTAESRDVTPPVLVHRVEPVYSDAARRSGASGEIYVEAIINARGEVVS